MTFPLEDEPTVGNSEELEEQEQTYKAGQGDDDDSEDSAIGGAEGTVDGQ